MITVASVKIIGFALDSISYGRQISYWSEIQNIVQMENNRMGLNAGDKS